MLNRLAAFLTALLLPAAVFAQDITGDWSGMLEVPTGSLKLIVNVSRNEAGAYSSSLQAPAQSPKKMAADITQFESGVLRIEITSLHVVYSATLKGDSLVNGTYTQGMSFPLNMVRGRGAKAAPRLRPQEPKPPFPYQSEEVTFRNTKDSITLAGTLTLPPGRGKHPCAILITGSGPENRDEEVFGHKPFLVLADYLSRQGIAVLRVDDRGVGKSEGHHGTATTPDFANDVRAAIAFLKSRKDINRRKIGLIGHSEGGAIGGMVAADNKDVDFLVLLAGPGLRGDQVLLQQSADLGRVQGMSDSDLLLVRERNEAIYRILLHPRDTARLGEELTEYLKSLVAEDPDNEQTGSADAAVAGQVAQLTSPWVRFFVAYDPAEALRRVDCPVLALNGSKDLQVNAAQNLPAIRKALTEGGNKKVTTEELPGLNHLFQESSTGNPAEYGSIEQTFSPAALERIAGWLQRQLR